MAKKDWKNKLYNNLKKLGIISENGVTMKDVQNNNTTGKPWIDAIIRAGEALSGTDTWVDRAVDNAAQQGDYKRVAEIGKDAAKGAAEGYMASLVLPEFVTYGFPIGLARLGVGTAAGAASGAVGGYVGSGADQLIHDLSGGKYNGNIGRNTLGLTSSLIGFGAGMNSLNPILRKAAGSGITLHIPEETFWNLREQAFNKQFNGSIKPLLVSDKYFTDPNSAYRATTSSEIIDLGKIGHTRLSSQSPLAKENWSQGYQGWLKGASYMQEVENSKNPFTKIKHAGLLKDGVILETSGIGKQFRPGYHGKAGELLPFEEINVEPKGVLDPKTGWYKEPDGGLAMPYTFRGLALGVNDPPISSDAISYFTRAKNGKWQYQGSIPQSKTIELVPSSKQTRVISEGTYPLYTGPKHSITEVVNPDGTINPRAALHIEREVADNIPGAYRMETRLENPEWHPLDPTTWDHTRRVAQSAWTIPTPKGFTKQDQMVSALGHDFGKIVAGEGHGPIGADLISQIFPDATVEQLTAIREHMGTPKTTLGLMTKQADILNGQAAITRTVQSNGKIRLSLPSHTDAKPRQIVLEPQGDNKYYVHMRTWDGDHISASLSPEDKITLYNALYEELPEGAEILFPQSGSGNYATRGTVAGLQHLARDSRFVPSPRKGVLEYVDKDGSIKTFEGTGFIKKESYSKPVMETKSLFIQNPILDNASDVISKKPLSLAEKLGIPKGERSNPKALEDPYYWGYKQWNQRYNNAVESGNMEEVQRLRDLHFKVKAFNNKLINNEDPITLYHGNLVSDSKMMSMGLNPYSTYRTARQSSGYFAVEDPSIAKTYTFMPGSKVHSLYGYSRNPYIIDANGRSWTNVTSSFKSTDDIVNKAFNSGNDAVIINNVVDYGVSTPASHPRTPFTDYVFSPGRIKLKEAITEDGLGQIIPIVKRDNFHNPDIRYKQGGILKAQGGLKSIIEDRFPIAKTYEYNIYPDEEVSKGYGDIETFAGDWVKDVIHYNNGFNLPNRYSGETSIVFNPKKVTNEDIALDALHIAREQDPVYQDLLKKYEAEAIKTNYEDFRGDGPEEDFHNGVDGVLRGSMYQGDRIKAKYAPKEEYDWLYKTYPKLGEAFKNIKTYLESGYINPAIVIPENK